LPMSKKGITQLQTAGICVSFEQTSCSPQL
jgi:hypothetical protein